MDSGQVVPLFCISPKHSLLDCRYEWRNLSGEIGFNSPVIYANKPGVYRCSVHCSGQTFYQGVLMS